MDTERETVRDAVATEESERALEQQLEEARLGQHIPTVKPLQDADLDVRPPAKESYRMGLWASLKELVRYHETLLTLVERDIRVRYKQALLGGTWAILNPLVLMVVFTVVFGKIAKISPLQNVPYPIFSYVALVPWTLFQTSVGSGAAAVIGNSAIIRKVYCPREAFPLATVGSSIFDYLISFVILLGMLLYYGFPPNRTWVAVPGLLLMLIAISIALTMLVSISTAFYRDTKYAIPMILQVALYATPVAYPIEQVVGAPGRPTSFAPWLKNLYLYGNPLTPIMDGLRRTMIYGQWPRFGPTMVSLAVCLVLLVVAYIVFKRLDTLISDVV